ncbi:MAG TPA: ACT domain-containing protein [Desulfotomaculum sp.]|nr:ACT domain-containing protein [Desulfotomaculum sp.]
MVIPFALLRLKLINRPGTLAKVVAAIAREGGNLGGIDLISASPSFVIRDLMVRLREGSDIDGLIGALQKIPGIQVISIADRVMMRHLGGKIEIRSKRSVENWMVV